MADRTIPVPAMNFWKRLAALFKAPQDSINRSVVSGLDFPEGYVPAIGEEYLEGYEKVSTVFAATRRVSSDLASVPLLIEERVGADDWKPVDEDSGAFGDVAGVFKRVNPDEGRVTLWTRFHLYDLLAGRSVLLTDYLRPGRLPMDARRPANQFPQELWTLRPDRVEPILKNGRRVGYIYRPENGTAVKLRPDEILYHVTPSPLSDHDGTPPLMPAHRWAALESRLAMLNDMAIAKGNVKPFAVTTPTIQNVPVSLKPEQMAQFEADWRSKFKNGFLDKLVFLNNALSVSDIPLMFDGDQLLELARFSRDQIAMAYGIPPALLGKDVTDHNIDEQMPMYWEGTLEPRLKALEENLTEIVLPRFDDSGRLRARFDLDQVPAIQRMMEKRTLGLLPLAGPGRAVLSVNEIRARINAPPTENPEHDEVAGAPEPLALPPGGALPPALRSAPRTPSKAPVVAKKWIDDPVRHAKRIAVGASLDRLEEPVLRGVRAYFRDQQERVMGRLGGGEKAARVKAAEFEDIWQEALEVEQAGQMVLRIYLRILRDRGAEALREVGADLAVDVLLNDPTVQAFLRQEAYARGTAIAGTMAEKLRDLIADASEQGLTVQQLADDIVDLYGEVRRGHALTIARTETAAAYNQSTFEAWRASGVVVGRRWLTAGDEAVRDSHAAQDGYVVTLDGSYPNGLRFPGDPQGTAAEVINCFVPDTQVSGAFVGGLCADYSGPVRQIVTSRGHRLTVTPNHPVLTPQGWIPAHALADGDQLLSYSRNVNGSPLGNKDNNHGEARIEDVFQSLAADRGVSLQVIGPLDLHGDAVNAKQKIHVVRPDGGLLGNVNAGGAHRVGNVVLPPTTPGQVGLGRSGAGDLPLNGIGAAGSCDPCAAHLPLDSTAIALEDRPLCALRSGPAADLNAALSKPGGDGVTRHAEFIGKLLERGAGLIAPDHVIEVRDYEFTGHVYDLQSVSGWMVADGIVCSNCRCTEEAVLEGEDLQERGVRVDTRGLKEWFGASR